MHKNKILICLQSILHVQGKYRSNLNSNEEEAFCYWLQKKIWYLLTKHFKFITKICRKINLREKNYYEFSGTMISSDLAARAPVAEALAYYKIIWKERKLYGKGTVYKTGDTILSSHKNLQKFHFHVEFYK